METAQVSKCVGGGEVLLQQTLMLILLVISVLAERLERREPTRHKNVFPPPLLCLSCDQTSPRRGKRWHHGATGKNTEKANDELSRRCLCRSCKNSSDSGRTRCQKAKKVEELGSLLVRLQQNAKHV